jgi:hypothetical protein
MGSYTRQGSNQSRDGWYYAQAPSGSWKLESTTEGMEMVSITRYPMSMTGKKLRARLGIEERIFADVSFRLKYKFRRIPKSRRLQFLIYRANADTGITLSYTEQINMRRWFDAHKVRCFPMTKDCECYSCYDAPARIRHHVTPISKGGSNKKNNIVPLCDGCHLKIHPTMGRP